MILQIFIVLLLVVANGFFVAAEFALVKVRESEIEPAAAAGKRSARRVQHMLGHLDAYLSACQLGITLASLGLGWAGEPMVARMIEPAFAALGLPQEKVHYAAFPVAFVVITFLHLTIGEQAPKIAAIQKARATTLLVAPPLALFYRMFRPFIWFINLSSNATLRLVGLEAITEHDRAITEDEVRTILVQSAAVGHLGIREQRIMQNVLDLEEKVARAHMVPHNRIVFLDSREPIEKQLATAAGSGHTRLPLCDGGLDRIVGIVHLKDGFSTMARTGPLSTFSDLAREVLYLPETIKLDQLLKAFQKSHSHMAILVDEYGSVSGMITLENVIEEIVGPIEDEFDAETPLVVKQGPDRYEVEASCPIDTLAATCGVEMPHDASVDSIGGVLTEELGHIPRKGDEIRLGGHRFTVLEAEPTRVRRVRVEKLSPPESSGDAS